MKKKLQSTIYKAIKKLWPEADVPMDQVEIGYPPEGFGDYASNVAMKLAPRLKMKPSEIAERIKTELSRSAVPLEKVEVARPGFLNFFVKPEAIKSVVGEIIKQKDKYGKLDKGKGKKVMVEFGQPNTHKAITVGHLRSAISGLAVAKLLETLGYDVVKANYFGDIGMNVAKTTWEMMQRKLPDDFEKWNNEKKMEFIDEGYVMGSLEFGNNEELEKEIREVNKEIYGKKKGKAYDWYKKIRKWSIEYQDQIFAKLGIKYDRQYPESEVYREAIEIVKKYQNNLFEKSDGAVIYDGKKEGLTTWVFLTSEGNPTYSAKDLALALKKFSEYRLDESIVTTSVEQADYFKAIIHLLKKIDPELGKKYRHIPFGWLLAGNKKTSSRMGDTVKCVDILNEAESLAKKKIAIGKEYDKKTKQEIVEKVALAGIKFLILSHEFHKNINYDPDEFIRLDGFSGPFILYSYVRTQAILKKLGRPEKLDKEELSEVLNSKEELELVKQLAEFGDVVEMAGAQIAPHLICNYAYEVAQKFNSFYEMCPIKNAKSEGEKQARLALVEATGQVLKNSLKVLGIDTLEKM